MRRNFRSAVITIAGRTGDRGRRSACALAAAGAAERGRAPARDAAGRSGYGGGGCTAGGYAAERGRQGPAGLAQETVPATTMSAAPATRQLAAGGAGISCDDLGKLLPRTPLSARQSRQVALGAHRPCGRRAGRRYLDRRRRRRSPADHGGRRRAGSHGKRSRRAAQPAEPSVPAKKPVKTAHKPMPSREVATAEAAPPAPAPATGSGLFGLLHAPTRTGGGAWAMSW